MEQEAVGSKELLLGLAPILEPECGSGIDGVDDAPPRRRVEPLQSRSNAAVDRNSISPGTAGPADGP